MSTSWGVPGKKKVEAIFQKAPTKTFKAGVSQRQDFPYTTMNFSNAVYTLLNLQKP